MKYVVDGLSSTFGGARNVFHPWSIEPGFENSASFSLGRGEFELQSETARSAGSSTTDLNSSDTLLRS